MSIYNENKLAKEAKKEFTLELIECLDYKTHLSKPEVTLFSNDIRFKYKLDEQENFNEKQKIEQMEAITHYVESIIGSTKRISFILKKIDGTKFIELLIDKESVLYLMQQQPTEKMILERD